MDDSQWVKDFSTELDTYLVSTFTDSSDPADLNDRTLADLNQSNVVSSTIKSSEGKAHKVLLDIDNVNCRLVPSSTPGCFHFYADVNCSIEDYFNFLDAASKIGLVDSNFVELSRRRGFTSLRFPWVKKETT